MLLMLLGAVRKIILRLFGSFYLVIYLAVLFGYFSSYLAI